MGGWVITGSNKLLCYELDYDGQLRTQCFAKNLDRGTEVDVAGEGLRPGHEEMDTTVLLGLHKGDLQ